MSDDAIVGEGEESASDDVLTIATSYDAFNRPERLEYPRVGDVRTVVRYAYNPFDSTLDAVLDDLSDTIYFQVQKRDEVGRREHEVFGNQVESLRTFNKQRGWLVGINTMLGSTQIGRFRYDYDPRGNLTKRDSWFEEQERFVERFGYDELDRMRDWWRPEAGVSEGDSSRYTWKVHYGYDDIGNLRSRDVYESSSAELSEGARYEYPEAQAAQPHGVTRRLVNGQVASTFSYDASGRQWSRGMQSVEYTAFDLPRRFVGAGGFEARMIYCSERSRFRKTVRHNANRTVTTTYMDGLYERVEEESQETLHKFFIMSADRTVAQVERRSIDPGNAAVSYFHQDHLDSVSFSSTHEGVIEAPVHHDPYGNRFDPNVAPRLEAPAVAGLPDITRGFGGHEMEIEDFGVINMKGRIFDPVNGRFLSADPFVQSPDWGQSYNRYMYVMGNPLTYRDPSGFAREAPEEETDEDETTTNQDATSETETQTGEASSEQAQKNKEKKANSNKTTEEQASGKEGKADDGKAGPGTKAESGGATNGKKGNASPKVFSKLKHALEYAARESVKATVADAKEREVDPELGREHGAAVYTTPDRKGFVVGPIIPGTGKKVLVNSKTDSAEVSTSDLTRSTPRNATVVGLAHSHPVGREASQEGVLMDMRNARRLWKGTTSANTRIHHSKGGGGLLLRKIAIGFPDGKAPLIYNPATKEIEQ